MELIEYIKSSWPGWVCSNGRCKLGDGRERVCAGRCDFHPDIGGGAAGGQMICAGVKLQRYNREGGTTCPPVSYHKEKE